MLNVIGLGNSLKGDDGIGPVVIEELDKNGPVHNINNINAGSDAFTVLDFLTGSDPIVIIDCAQMGKKAGEVMIFDITETSIPEIADAISLHGFGFNDIYHMATQMGAVAPCTIIGIQPKQVDFCENLSEEVRASIPGIIDLVKLEAKKYA